MTAKRKPNRKRPYGVQVRFTLAEKIKLKKNAERRNMTVSSFVRYLTIGVLDNLKDFDPESDVILSRREQNGR